MPAKTPVFFEKVPFQASNGAALLALLQEFQRVANLKIQMAKAGQKGPEGKDTWLSARGLICACRAGGLLLDKSIRWHDRPGSHAFHAAGKMVLHRELIKFGVLNQREVVYIAGYQNRESSLAKKFPDEIILTLLPTRRYLLLSKQADYRLSDEFSIELRHIEFAFELGENRALPKLVQPIQIPPEKRKRGRPQKYVQVAT